jgi:ATP-dependent helicase/nuclease subunit A
MALTEGGSSDVQKPTEDQALAASPDASVWVSASAGTGKTRVLANRVLRLMLAGTQPQRILCLTYTRAAAAEMSNRINDTLGQWTLASDEALRAELSLLVGGGVGDEDLNRARRLFAQVLDVPGGLKIQTIHAFCQSLLGRFPVEAQLPPHFELMDTRTSAELMADASQTVLSRAQANASSPLMLALADVSNRVMADKFQELTQSLSTSRGRLTRLMDAYQSVDGIADRLRGLLDLTEDDDELGIIAAACRDDACDVAGLKEAAAILLGGSRRDVARGRQITQWLSDPNNRIENFNAYMAVFLTQKNEIRASLAAKAIGEQHPEVLEVLTEEAERLLRVDEKRRLALVAQATESLLRIGGAQLQAYGDAKAQRAVLDYDDLILETKKLLHLPDVAPWILYKLDGGIDHILIDEAQDTSPDQWQVVAALADEFFNGEGARDEGRSMFAVGDVKQSIYGFQGADPAEFDTMHRYFAQRARDSDRPFRMVPLETSFRSTAAVLGLVDEVFAPEDVCDGLAFDDDVIHHQAHRVGHGGLVELWPTIVPEELPDLDPWAPPIEQIRGSSPEENMADRIADTIRDWLDQGEMLVSKGRPIAPGDILVLVRRRTEFVEHLVRALKKRRIPVAGADRMVLTEQLAVMDLLALGRFALLPDDDLTLAEVLKGPLVGMNDDQLYDVAFDRGQRGLWQSLRAKAPDGGIFSEATDFLSEQLALADYMPPFEFYARVLSLSGGRRRMVGRLGTEANDPIDEFMNLCLEYESSHPPSLQGFIHWIEAAKSEVKRDAEHARDEVRVMTVHGAKGLEAPVVFLPDTTGIPTHGDSFLWLNDHGQDAVADSPGVLAWPVRRENEAGPCDAARTALRSRGSQEYRRLLYVALTRAEDRLYVCGWETRNGRAEGCWYDLVADAFDRLPGVEDFDQGDNSLIRQFASLQTAPVELSPPTSEEALRAPVPNWARQAPEPEPVPPRPLAPSQPDVDPPPVLSPVDQVEESGGLLRGRMVHRLLQLLPDLAPDQRVPSAQRYLSQTVPEWGSMQVEALVTEVIAVLNDPGFTALFGANSQAEVAIAGMVGDFAISGQIDRIVVSDDEVLIVDYKTNRQPPADESHVSAAYLGQMATYKAALAEVFPGRRVRCALLWTEGPRLMPLTDL